MKESPLNTLAFSLTYSGFNCQRYTTQPSLTESLSLLQTEFLTTDESRELLEKFDGLPWETSQSGRRKQNFGPKANFKKRKLQLGGFKGFPSFSRILHDKLRRVPLTADYQTIEQCSLEYDRNRGASIEPHIDDCWIWGERIVTINLLGDSVLTMTKYHGDDSKYNLKLVDVVDLPADVPDVCVRVPMPTRSLLVITNSARYQWEHCVLRRDISERRVCIAMREFTRPYLQPDVEAAQTVLRAASTFF